MRAPTRKGSIMAYLRDRGIYVLPDGGRYVAEKNLLGTFHLYENQGGPDREPRYRVNKHGEVVDPVTLGVIFTPDQLIDTGEDRRKHH
jgi:hypothetical protein